MRIWIVNLFFVITDFQDNLKNVGIGAFQLKVTAAWPIKPPLGKAEIIFLPAKIHRLGLWCK